jgi:hypothetical protein
LIVASAALTTVYACITPFVAFAVIAATTLPRSGALALTLAVWLANQVVGYGVLNYPWTARSVGWGIALGGAAVLAALSARWVATRRQATESAAWTLAAFVPAFAVHQLMLYALAVSVLGGTGGFSREIVGRVLVVNAVTLVGLYGLNQLAAILGLAGQRASKSTAVVLPPLTTTPTRSPLAGA